MLLSIPKHRDKIGWHLHVAAFMFLWCEVNVRFPANMVNPSGKINVLPRCECDFLFTTGGTEKKLVANDFLGLHGSEQLFQFGRFIRYGRLLFKLWQIGSQRKFCL